MAEARRGVTGGIVGLFDFIKEHEEALAYDWRTRFHLPLSSAFDGTMAWWEVVALVRTLASDPTSRLCMSLNDWQYPFSTESFILADIYDSYATINFKNPKKYPRPMDARPNKQKAPTISQEAIKRGLLRRGHGRRKEVEKAVK